MTAPITAPASQTPAPLQPHLALTDVIPLAKSLARGVARNPSDVDDLVQVALFAFHTATRRVEERGIEIQKPYAHARAVMQRAMWGFYSSPEPDMEELSSAESRGICGSVQADIFEGLEEYFEALERECGAVARLMVENLLSPTGECCQRLLHSVGQKRLIQDQCNAIGWPARAHLPRGARRRVRISNPDVRKGLGLSSSEWSRHMARIREFTKEWLQLDQAG